MPQALADCNKAESLAGKLPVIAELHVAVTNAMKHHLQSQQQRNERVAQAHEHLDHGRLSACENVLDGAAGDRAAHLQQAVATRRDSAESDLANAAQAIERRDWHLAVKALRQARQCHASDRRLAELTGRLKNLLSEATQTAINDGRLDRAATLLALLEDLADQAMEVRELHHVIERCRQAYEFIDAGRPRQAGAVLRRFSCARLARDFPFSMNAALSIAISSPATSSTKTAM